MGSEPGPGFPYGGAGLARSVLVGLGLGQSGWVISVLIQKFCFPMFVCLFLEVCISGSLGLWVRESLCLSCKSRESVCCFFLVLVSADV